MMPAIIRVMPRMRMAVVCRYEEKCGTAGRSKGEPGGSKGEPGGSCPQTEASSEQGENQDDDENRSENTHRSTFFLDEYG